MNQSAISHPSSEPQASLINPNTNQIMNPLQEYTLSILDSTMQAFTDIWETNANALSPQMLAKTLIAYGGAYCALCQCKGADVNNDVVKHAEMLLHDAETQMLDQGVM